MHQVSLTFGCSQ